MNRSTFALLLLSASLAGACDDADAPSGSSFDSSPSPTDAAGSTDAQAPGDDAEPGPHPDAGPGVDAAPIDECEAENGGCGDPETWRCHDTPRTPPDCVFIEAEDYATLTDGVARLQSGGALPDSMILYGPTTFAVALDEQRHPFIVAARVGDGKLLHLAHESHMRTDGDGDSHRLIFNALAWMTRGDAGAVVGVEQGVDIDFGPLTDLGYDVRRVQRGAFQGLNVYLGTTYADFDEAYLRALDAFFARGGGVISGGHAWWWAQSSGVPAATHFPGNALLGRAGVVVTGWGDIQAQEDSVGATAPGPLHNARYALAALVRHEAGAELTAEALSTATYTVARALRALPLDSTFFTQARALLNGAVPQVPTTDRPLVPGDDPVAAALAELEIRLALDAQPDAIRVSTSAADFPGAVTEDAPRGAVTLEIDASYAGRDPRYAYSNAQSPAWRSVGRYAAPGEVITVTIPAEVAGAGLEVQIGCHTDILFANEEWRRMPRIVNTRALSTEETQVANGFGGPIYLRVPVGTALGPIEVTVDGGVEMPRYVEGETDLGRWRDRVRHAPAPWAEFESARFIVTVPAAAVVDLEAPDEVTALWDSVLDASADLAGIPRERPRVERFVLDRQIGGGWMHSGYPLMGHLESVDEFLDPMGVRANGAWGPFHEIGHNHQWAPWVLPGTTETSVNLWSVYVSEAVFGIDRGVAHEALSPQTRADRMARYLAGGANFESWSVWVALESYLQLQEAFGWAPFTALFREYRDLPAGMFAGEQAMIDEWVMRSSRAFGHDLGPFYAAWGLPISAAARREAARSPAWDEDPMN